MKKNDRELLIISNTILNKINATNKLFEEVGITNGLEIIEEFIAFNERGLAFEHLVYVIESSNYKTTSQEKKKIKEIEKKMR